MPRYNREKECDNTAPEIAACSNVQPSVDKKRGLCCQGVDLMKVTPLNCGRKWHHQRKSDLSSEVNGQRRDDGLASQVFNRPDMKMRAGRTQAVTKDTTPSKDCNKSVHRGLTEKGPQMGPKLHSLSR